MSETITQKHPKGLYFIYTVAIAERFGYYGMRALFVLYMIKALMIDKELSAIIYGNYTGLVYLTPLIGGYVADKYWGMRRSMFWGAVLMVIGQLFMFLSAVYYQHGDLAKWLMYIGLGGLIFGNGFFKPNVTTFVGQLYEKGDRRLDSAYTIFYMGVNLGAFVSPLVCGYLGDTGNPADFKWGFLSAAVVSVLCLVIYMAQKEKYLVGPNGNPLGVIPAAKIKSNEEVQNAIFKNLSKRLAVMIKEDMEFMGPVRMKDVEEAQQKIVNTIRKLEDSAEIVISRGGGDEIIV